MLYTILVVIQVLIAISLIGLILIQHGKGADAGAAFGSGASGTVFGSQGSANFLSRATAALAAVFFAVSLSLAYLVAGSGGGDESVTERLQAPGTELLEEAPGTDSGNDAGSSSAPEEPATPAVPE